MGMVYGKRRVGGAKKNRCAQPRTRRVTSTLIVTGSGPVSVNSETPLKLLMPSPPPGKHTWCVLFHLPFITRFYLTRQISQHENKARPPDDPSLSVSTLSSVPSSPELHHFYALIPRYLHPKVHLGHHVRCAELTDWLLRSLRLLDGSTRPMTKLDHQPRLKVATAGWTRETNATVMMLSVMVINANRCVR
jgi:hypothetical protein